MSQAGLEVETIYQYNTGRNVPWNIVEYQPVRQYLDHNQLHAERTGEKKATTQRYVTKRGSFLDHTIKNLKDLPAPCKYDFPSEFDQTLNKKESKKHKIDFKLRKNTYLEQIQSEAKMHKRPAVGQYQLAYTSRPQSKKKKHSIDPKRFFYEDAELLSTTVPGSGCYYPHDEVRHPKQERTNHKYWIDKHRKQNDKSRKRSLKDPDPGTYRPVSASFSSFDRMKIDNEIRQKKMAKKTPSHGFGSSDSKFDYQRVHKSKGQKRPDPCNYNTMIEWKGKGLDAKKNNWVRCLSAGRSRGVYH